jgi:hypothetical protein
MTSYLLPAMKTVIITFRKSFTIEGLGLGLEIGFSKWLIWVFSSVSQVVSKSPVNSVTVYYY